MVRIDEKGSSVQKRYLSILTATLLVHPPSDHSPTAVVYSVNHRQYS